MQSIFSYAKKNLLQEEFESLKEAAASVLGDAQHKARDKMHQASVAPTTDSTSTLATLTPFANKTLVDGLAEVQYNFLCVSASGHRPITARLFHRLFIAKILDSALKKIVILFGNFIQVLESMDGVRKEMAFLKRSQVYHILITIFLEKKHK